MNILIVDDDAVDRKLIKRALSTTTHFHNIVEVASVTEGLDASLVSHFDIILLDCNMPEVDGIEMLIEMRAKPNLGNTAIIMISSSDDSPLALDCIEAGAQDFLPKSDISIRDLNKSIMYAKKRFETEQRMHESYLTAKHMAECDTLTGLSNRYHFEETVKEMIGREGSKSNSMALLALDIDNFKHINDTLGHDVGDDVLKEVVVRIKRVLSRHERFARLGGDEFAVMMSQVRNADEVNLLSSRMLTQFQDPMVINDKIVNCSISIGSAVFPSDASRFHELLKCADIAMYHSKQNGKNQFSCYKPYYQTEFNRRFNIQNEIKNIIKEETFRLFYQPIYSTQTEAIVGFEALIRWPEMDEMFTPDEFIPVAEECGLISELGKWIISTAVQQVALWRENFKLSLTIAVNISPVQLQDKNLLPHLIDTVKKNGVPSDSITLEITETALFKDSEKITETLRQLSQHGFKIALDDFGMGYSSIAHLIEYPIDIVKLDRSMQSFVDDGCKRYKVLESLAYMLNKLDLTIVAEGIETESQSSLCKQLNLDYKQGFLLSRPLPVDQIDAMLASLP